MHSFTLCMLTWCDCVKHAPPARSLIQSLRTPELKPPADNHHLLTQLSCQHQLSLDLNHKLKATKGNVLSIVHCMGVRKRKAEREREKGRKKEGKTRRYSMQLPNNCQLVVLSDIQR